MEMRERSFNWGERTYLMGVLNVTPDSFSDGGEFYAPAAALAQAQRLVEAWGRYYRYWRSIDSTGCSTVSVEEELNRVLPVVQALRSVLDVPISVDTTRAVCRSAEPLKRVQIW
jgi:dihydropteroate synthase